MSAEHAAVHGQHAHGHDAHGHGHDDEHDGGADHGTMRDYVTGFVMSVVLTAIPFWLIMGDVFRSQATASIVVILFGVAQIYVHMVYFLHMNAKSQGGWTLMAAGFTIVLVVITLVGSAWIMFHLNTNMMPMDHKMEPIRSVPGATPTPERPDAPRASEQLR